MRTLGELFDKPKELDTAEIALRHAEARLNFDCYTRKNAGKQGEVRRISMDVLELRAVLLPSTDHPGGGNGE